MGQECVFHNLRRATRAVTQLYDAYFDELGIKATQFTLLAVVAHAADDPPTVTELAQSLLLEQSSLSRNLAVLDRLGHVKLVPRASDRRERVVTLTASGRRLLARGYPRWKEAQACVTESLGADLSAHLGAVRRLTKAALSVRGPVEASVPVPAKGGRSRR